jgi:hypothetical protein
VVRDVVSEEHVGGVDGADDEALAGAHEHHPRRDLGADRAAVAHRADQARHRHQARSVARQRRRVERQHRLAVGGHAELGHEGHVDADLVALPAGAELDPVRRAEPEVCAHDRDDLAIVAAVGVDQPRGPVEGGEHLATSVPIEA